MRTKIYLTLLALCLFSASANAQTVPALVNYQGRLANPDGTALATGDYQLTFRVYDSATNSAATNLVWGPQVFDGVAGQGHGGKIPVVQGYFNVMLGPVDTTNRSLADAFTATNRFVEIQVGTNSSILPRQQILSAPYALNSAKLAGYDWSDLLGTNNPLAGVLPFGKLPSRIVGTNVPVGGLARSLPLVEQILSGAGSTSYQDLQNLTVTIQTSGRPVLAFLTSTYTNSLSATPASTSVTDGFLYNEDPTGATGHFRLVRNNGESAMVTNFGDGSGTTVSYRTSHPICMFFDVPNAGTNTYKLQWGFESNPGNGSARLGSSSLIVFEL